VKLQPVEIKNDGLVFLNVFYDEEGRYAERRAYVPVSKSSGPGGERISPAGRQEAWAGAVSRSSFTFSAAFSL